LEAVIIMRVYFANFSCAATTIWSYGDRMGRVWSYRQDLLQWSYRKTS